MKQFKPKAKKCKNCGKQFMPYRPLQVTCAGVTCALEYAQKNREKRERKANRQAKQAIKTLQQLCAETQEDVNRYIVARDRFKGCISCGTGKVTDAGHLIHAGSKYRTSRLRFDHRIINGQCMSCNRYAGGGNMAGYIPGYIARYGEEAYRVTQDLKRMADSGELEPLTKEEVKQIAAEHRRMTREFLTNQAQEAA